MECLPVVAEASEVSAESAPRSQASSKKPKPRPKGNSVEETRPPEAQRNFCPRRKISTLLGDNLRWEVSPPRQPISRIINMQPPTINHNSLKKTSSSSWRPLPQVTMLPNFRQSQVTIFKSSKFLKKEQRRCHSVWKRTRQRPLLGNWFLV